MVAKANLIGQRFGRLVVVAPAENWVQPSGQTKVQWKCRCDCGTVKVIRSGDLKGGHTSSCGCLSSELTSERLTIHGNNKRGKQTVNYRLWFSIKQRCCDSNNKRYRDYGGRGIDFYPEWRDSFQAFDKYLREALGPRPAGQTLDRRNNDLGYIPGNLRWATYKQQANNRRRRKGKE